jgi:hypothetical protein
MQSRVEVEALSLTNLDRNVQLLNKTNQINPHTRRMSGSELPEWSSCPGHHLATFRDNLVRGSGMVARLPTVV